MPRITHLTPCRRISTTGVLVVAVLAAACGRVHFDPIVDASPDDGARGDGGAIGDGAVGDGAMACRMETETCDQVTLVCCMDLICINIGGTMRCD